MFQWIFHTINPFSTILQSQKQVKQIQIDNTRFVLYALATLTKRDHPQTFIEVYDLGVQNTEFKFVRQIDHSQITKIIKAYYGTSDVPRNLHISQIQVVDLTQSKELHLFLLMSNGLRLYLSLEEYTTEKLEGQVLQYNSRPTGNIASYFIKEPITNVHQDIFQSCNVLDAQQNTVMSDFRLKSNINEFYDKICYDKNNTLVVLQNSSSQSSVVAYGQDLISKNALSVQESVEQIIMGGQCDFLIEPIRNEVLVEPELANSLRFENFYNSHQQKNSFQLLKSESDNFDF